MVALSLVSFAKSFLHFLQTANLKIRLIQPQIYLRLEIYQSCLPSSKIQQGLLYVLILLELGTHELC